MSYRSKTRRPQYQQHGSRAVVNGKINIQYERNQGSKTHHPNVPQAQYSNPTQSNTQHIQQIQNNSLQVDNASELKTQIDSSKLFQSCICRQVRPGKQNVVKCLIEDCNRVMHTSCLEIQMLAEDPKSEFYCVQHRCWLSDPFWKPLQYFYNFPTATTRTGVMKQLGGHQPCTVPEKSFKDGHFMVGCFCQDDVTPFRFHWPRSCDLIINGNRKLVATRSSHTKLGQYSRDEALNITPFVLAGNNKLEIMCADNRQYMAMVYLCKAQTVEQIKELMLKPENPESTRQRMIKAQLEDDGLEISGITLSLKDPLTSMKIKVPARFANLESVNTFDLDNFIDMAKRTRKWTCPHSNKHSNILNLQVDSYLVSVLESLRNDPQVMEVEVNKQGDWKSRGSSQEWRSIHGTVSELNNQKQMENQNQSNNNRKAKLDQILNESSSHVTESGQIQDDHSKQQSSNDDEQNLVIKKLPQRPEKRKREHTVSVQSLSSDSGNSRTMNQPATSQSQSSNQANKRQKRHITKIDTKLNQKLNIPPEPPQSPIPRQNNNYFNQNKQQRQTSNQNDDVIVISDSEDDSVPASNHPTSNIEKNQNQNQNQNQNNSSKLQLLKNESQQLQGKSSAPNNSNYTSRWDVYSPISQAAQNQQGQQQNKQQQYPQINQQYMQYAQEAYQKYLGQQPSNKQQQDQQKIREYIDKIRAEGRNLHQENDRSPNFGENVGYNLNHQPFSSPYQNQQNNNQSWQQYQDQTRSKSMQQDQFPVNFMRTQGQNSVQNQKWGPIQEYKYSIGNYSPRGKHRMGSFSPRGANIQQYQYSLDQITTRNSDNNQGNGKSTFYDIRTDKHFSPNANNNYSEKRSNAPESSRYTFGAQNYHRSNSKESSKDPANLSTNSIQGHIQQILQSPRNTIQKGPDQSYSHIIDYQQPIQSNGVSALQSKQSNGVISTLPFQLDQDSGDYQKQAQIQRDELVKIQKSLLHNIMPRIDKSDQSRQQQQQGQSTPIYSTSTHYQINKQGENQNAAPSSQIAYQNNIQRPGVKSNQPVTNQNNQQYSSNSIKQQQYNSNQFKDYNQTHQSSEYQNQRDQCPQNNNQVQLGYIMVDLHDYINCTFSSTDREQSTPKFDGHGAKNPRQTANIDQQNSINNNQFQVQNQKYIQSPQINGDKKIPSPQLPLLQIPQQNLTEGKRLIKFKLRNKQDQQSLEKLYGSDENNNNQNNEIGKLQYVNTSKGQVSDHSLQKTQQAIAQLQEKQQQCLRDLGIDQNLSEKASDTQQDSDLQKILSKRGIQVEHQDFNDDEDVYGKLFEDSYYDYI